MPLGLFLFAVGIGFLSIGSVIGALFKSRDKPDFFLMSAGVFLAVFGALDILSFRGYLYPLGSLVLGVGVGRSARWLMTSS
jgi:hypothetical protein